MADYINKIHSRIDNKDYTLSSTSAVTATQSTYFKTTRTNSNFSATCLDGKGFTSTSTTAKVQTGGSVTLTVNDGTTKSYLLNKLSTNNSEGYLDASLFPAAGQWFGGTFITQGPYRWLNLSAPFYFQYSKIKTDGTTEILRLSPNNEYNQESYIIGYFYSGLDYRNQPSLSPSDVENVVIMFFRLYNNSLYYIGAKTNHTFDIGIVRTSNYLNDYTGVQSVLKHNGNAYGRLIIDSFYVNSQQGAV